MNPISLSALSLVSSLGDGIAATARALHDDLDGLTPCDFEGVDLDTYIGVVKDLDQVTIPSDLKQFDCRNTRLAQRALAADDFEKQVRNAIDRYGADRVGVVIGTTSSGIQEAERAFAQRASDDDALPNWFDFKTTQSHYSVTDYVSLYFGLQSPAAYTVSTACSSSNKAFGDAAQLLESGVCDCVIAGGVDSLCWMSLCGFNSLQLLSPKPCRPNDVDRDGISIGEAAGFVLLEREEDAKNDGRIWLKGYGESTDAYHMSAPHPDGLGAKLAMESALASAGLSSSEIDYVNLHGTGSHANDLAEDKAVADVFGEGQACSSTKGWTGHTLGAAGIVETVIAALCLRDGFMAKNKNLQSPEPDLSSRILDKNVEAAISHVLTNSFGFGGNNCSLVLGKC